MLFENSRVRRRLAVRNPMTIKIALPLDDHRKLEAFVALLAQIDKRNNPSTPPTSLKLQRSGRLRRTRATGKETKSRDPTKAKDALLGQYKKGSPLSGPFLFLINKLSCIIDHLIFSLVYAYDRYDSSSSPSGYIHY